MSAHVRRHSTRRDVLVFRNNNLPSVLHHARGSTPRYRGRVGKTTESERAEQNEKAYQEAPGKSVSSAFLFCVAGCGSFAYGWGITPRSDRGVWSWRGSILGKLFHAIFFPRTPVWPRTWFEAEPRACACLRERGTRKARGKVVARARASFFSFFFSSSSSSLLPIIHPIRPRVRGGGGGRGGEGRVG